MDDAPTGPGVYVFLGEDQALLYVGVASNLRRRLQQHAQRRDARLASMYERAVVVRWETCASEAAAHAREADLVLVLRPACNGAITFDGRWSFVVVDDAGVHLSPAAMPAAHGRSYGVFPHLGKGVAARPAIACSDGFAALLRLLWAASDAPGAMPARLARGATSVSCRTDDPALHRFLSGTSARLADVLLDRARERRDVITHAALARDRDAALGFVEHGPKAVRALRLRHGLPTGPVDRATFEACVRAEAEACFGPVRTIVPAPDPAMGRRRVQRFPR